MILFIKQINYGLDLKLYSFVRIERLMSQIFVMPNFSKIKKEIILKKSI